MQFTVRVQGTVPHDPETGVAEFACHYAVLVHPVEFAAWIYNLTFSVSDPQFTFWVDVGALGSDDIGTRDWEIRCTNSRWMPFTESTDIGTFTVY